jgi:hypothetical protein
MSTHANAPLTPEGRRRLWGVGKNAVTSRNRAAVARAKGRLRGKQPKLSAKQQTELRRMHTTGRLLHRRPRRALQHRPSHRVPDTPAPSHQRKLSNPSSSFAAGDTILTGTPSLQTHRRWPPTRARRRRRRHQPRHADQVVQALAAPRRPWSARPDLSPGLTEAERQVREQYRGEPR